MLVGRREFFGGVVVVGQAGAKDGADVLQQLVFGDSGVAWSGGAWSGGAWQCVGGRWG